MEAASPAPRERLAPLSRRDGRKVLAQFAAGLPPHPRDAVRLLAGLDSLIDDWRRDLDGYVSGGGSLLRIIVGPPGCGKTHLGEALKAIAAERGFLVCKVDTQAQRTGGDDLELYRAFCQGIAVPKAYLASAPGTLAVHGLVPVLEDVAQRYSGAEVREVLRETLVPLPAIKTALAAVVDWIRAGRLGTEAASTDEACLAMVTALGGERPLGIGSLSRLRARFGQGAFVHLTRLPGRRDARLWLESLLLLLRPLGFPGVAIVVDEHDDAVKKSLDGSIAQLRQQLDRLAEGHLPGAFVLYLVLDDFQNRVKEGHSALEQRIAPILPAPLRSRLMSELSAIRDRDGPAFLQAVAERMYGVLSADPMPPLVALEAARLSIAHCKLAGADTRAFVKAFAAVLDEL